MADPKTPAAKVPSAPAAKPAAAAPAEAPKKEKRKRTEYQQFFPSADEATKAASERTKGPRRAFTVTNGSVTEFIVHNNEGRAAGAFAMKHGVTVTELGGRARKTKLAGVDQITNAINALPEDQRAAIVAALSAMGKK